MVGLFYIDGEQVGYTLEDPLRDEKVKGITAIPDGTYKIGLKEFETPLTLRYRERFKTFFDYHLEIKDVPNFTDIYIHIGNTEEDSYGCPLLGLGITYNRKLTYSTLAFMRVYPVIRQALRDGREVDITIFSLLKWSNNGRAT